LSVYCAIFKRNDNLIATHILKTTENEYV